MDIRPLTIILVLVSCAIPAVVYTYIGEKIRKRLEKSSNLANVCGAV